MKSARARAIVAYLAAHDYPYARLENAETGSNQDLIDLVVEPELPQDRAVAIIDAEPIRLSIPVDDSTSPFVFSRRSDFPHNQVHTNAAPDSNGICLCIWEENWADLRRGLTAQALIERIRNWFTRMATNTLHQEGQALEPLLRATANSLILPAAPLPTNLAVWSADKYNGQWTMLLGPPRAKSQEEQFEISVLTVTFPPQVQGALLQAPQTLSELIEFAAAHGVPDSLTQIKSWLLQPEQLQRADKRHVLLMLKIPKLKEVGGEVEGCEVRAFMPDQKLSQLGELLGGTYFQRGTVVARIPAGAAGDLSKTYLDQWRVIWRLDRATARLFAASPIGKDRRLVAIGAGAIGSNVVVGTTRAGIGIWTIIDDDIVLPHNTVRQFQDNRAVGVGKAMALALDANCILADHDSANEIRANILDPGELGAEIDEKFEQADLVVDFSASPAVLGYVADHGRLRRAVSCFFNPSGSDLVILAEDPARALRLDEIEAQYFLAVAIDDRLQGHLSGGRLDFIRYANACQDLSRPLPPWQVQTLTGLAGGQLIGLFERTVASSQVWRLDPQNGAIAPVNLELSGVERHTIEDWRFTISHFALNEMQRLRGEAAPNETGGILIGTFDLSRRVVHILAALRAPPDSAQSPTYFIRGAKDLKPMVDRLGVASAGSLGYVGEWHSHPDGTAVRPSNDDEQVFAHLAKHMGPTGGPFLMAICGREEFWFRLGADGRTYGEAVTHGKA